MKTGIHFGRQVIAIEVPDFSKLLEPFPLPGLSNKNASVRAALKTPYDSPSLSLLAKNKKSACIVISDITRPVPNKVILPPILETLESAGINRNSITLLVANGMHRPVTESELLEMLGEEIVNRYAIVNHYCRKKEDLREIARIDGAPIELNRYFLDADLKILTGLIEPHMYAGYSGGRKSLLPGISSFETMKFMHSFRMIDHARVTNAILEENPFHEAGLQVTQLTDVDFILNVVINKSRDIVGLFAGNAVTAHLEGCKLVEKMAVRYQKESVDLVITSAGGYPLDATFYQVSKGLINAKNLIKKGGTIVMICECREGLGSQEYGQMVKKGLSPAEFFEYFSRLENFEIDQWCLQTTYQALAHAGKIYIYSPNLREEDLKAIGIVKINQLQAEIDQLTACHEKIIVCPDGPYVVGLVDQKKFVYSN